MGIDLKKSFVSFTLISSLMLGEWGILPLSASWSMDMAKPTQNYGNLSAKVQDTLKTTGYQILHQVLSDQGFDVANSGLFDQLNPILEPELPGALYSQASKLAPSNLFRWGFSSSDKTYITARKNQILAIVCIGWALADMAAQQGEFFERGSFTLIDPHNRLYHFLLDYVKLTTGFSDPQQVPFAFTKCNFAYRRDPEIKGSSHHKGHCPESQFGIDVRFDPWGGVYMLLPFNSTHLLFANINIGSAAYPQTEPLLFVKFEPLGMGSMGATISHGTHFLHSQSHVGSQDRREKDILPPLQDAFNSLKTEARLQGEYPEIRSMLFAAQNILKSPDQYTESVVNKAADFIKLVDQTYPNGNNHLRVGNEVIIDLSNQ